MNSSVQQPIAWEKEMVASCVVVLTQGMPNPRATFANMQRFAGEKMLLLLRTTHEAFKQLARCWESKRPFNIVNDCGFQSLMKTGRPGYQIPSAETVSRDVKKVFVQVRKHIANMLKVLFMVVSHKSGFNSPMDI
jgi:hypothetical protein